MGVHEDKLTSFEYALRNAGIAGTNLVLISSIFPPGAKLISRTAGLKLIKPGQILFTIYSKNQTNDHAVTYSFSWNLNPIRVSLRITRLEVTKGGRRMQKILPRKCSQYSICDKSWDEKRQQWTISIYKTSNYPICGKWTTSNLCPKKCVG